MQEYIHDILIEDDRRCQRMVGEFDPISGRGSVGEREEVFVKGLLTGRMWLPVGMMRVPLVQQLVDAGDIGVFLTGYMHQEDCYENRLSVLEAFCRLRWRFDFPFWAASLTKIKNKEPGKPDCFFRLTSPQRRLVETLEADRLAGRPIRLILLKARQWGGSTTIQIYMAWLQLVHKKSLNSLILAHLSAAAEKIKAMYKKLMDNYPIAALYAADEEYDPKAPMMRWQGHSGLTQEIPSRSCSLSIGSAESPDSCRGGDYSLVHISEVGLMKATEGKKPEDIVRSACSGVLYRPYTMIVYESTANGVGNFFHREYMAAKDGTSQFKAMFVPWFEIELYRIKLSRKERERLAQQLYQNRDNTAATSDREEPGRYLWMLWESGATLEGIAWYIEERKKHNDHAGIASEFPSDDIEAFVHSGSMVFNRYEVERLRKGCRAPRYVGDMVARGARGYEALQDVDFSPMDNGLLKVWDLPEHPLPSDTERCENQYLVVVDIGGRSAKADWSVITVFDRYWLTQGERLQVVAQWRGHIDLDLLAWKAAQVAKWYNNALLVIESNTAETRDKERDVEGDQAPYILNLVKDVYPNLYARESSEEDIREGRPKRYGFHTNTKTKPAVITHLQFYVRDNLYVEREETALNEMLVYEKRQNGSFSAIIGQHDDVLMTRAIGVYVSDTLMPPPRIVPVKKEKTVKRKTMTEASII